MQLVLSSKVEEDKRKTEEAKLKQKELEYLIISKGRNIFLLDFALVY